MCSTTTSPLLPPSNPSASFVPARWMQLRGHYLGIIEVVRASFGHVTADYDGQTWVTKDTLKPLKFQWFRSRSLGAGDENRTRVLSLGS